MRTAAISACFLVLLAAPAFAAPVSIDLPQPVFALKPGAGMDIAANDCQVCHSLDYILTQPPHMGDKFWDGEVQKMIKTYGAQISDSDAQAIAAYLKANY
jgi:sulfite dehydrogenase (cytochrome) subunit B